MPRSARPVLCFAALLLATGSPTLRQPGRAVVPNDAGCLHDAGGSCFVPNLGQWDHPARFVRRGGALSLFLEDRGFLVDMVESREAPGAPARGVALRMTFEGDAHRPELRGEDVLPGHHNYFIGNDPARWRTDVPRFGAVVYRDLYPGIDLRLRETAAAPEYDLLLAPGADLDAVVVHVEGADGLSIAPDGSLVASTPLGPLTQPRPKTWQVDAAGARREIACRFVRLGAARFGFAADGWDRSCTLTIDPPLLWSTYLGGPSPDRVYAIDGSPDGTVTAVGGTGPGFPTTPGSYQTVHNNANAFVTTLDPSRQGAAQLLWSTYFGGTIGYSEATLVDVGEDGVVTFGGITRDLDMPAVNAYSGKLNYLPGFVELDAFLARLDPRKSGTGQLTWSTYLGGTRRETPSAIAVDAQGVVTVAGETTSTDYPVPGGFQQVHTGTFEAFVSRLDPKLNGLAQLTWSTYLGGRLPDRAYAVDVDGRGIVTVAGETASSGFPVTSNAYDPNYKGVIDGFITRLDPSLPPASQLLYSTFLGAGGMDIAYALHVSDAGIVTVGGTRSSGFLTTPGAYSRTQGWCFISRLDLNQPPANQLIYSTYLGGTLGSEAIQALAVDADGVVTCAGMTQAADFPTTPGAFARSHNRVQEMFVARLDTSTSKLLYSTFFPGVEAMANFPPQHLNKLAVDPCGVATIAGLTGRTIATTPGAYLGSPQGSGDGFVSRLDMGVAFHADRYRLSIGQGGVQELRLAAGTQHAGRSYAVFGSVSGTTPGINLLGLHIPLNVDPYTDFTIAFPGAPPFGSFRGVLGPSGEATAQFRLPTGLPQSLIGLQLHHAYLVFDANGWHMASNAVPVRLVQ